MVTTRSAIRCKQLCTCYFCIPRSSKNPYLPPEIWTMIFRSVVRESDIHTKWGKFTTHELLRVRLVSKDFNTCITPLLFERIYLPLRIVGLVTSSDSVEKRILSHIQNFTKQVTLSTNVPFESRVLPWRKTANLLNSCIKIQDIFWEFGVHEPIRLPKTIQRALAMRLSHVRLHAMPRLCANFVDSSHNNWIDFPNQNLTTFRSDSDVPFRRAWVQNQAAERTFSRTLTKHLTNCPKLRIIDSEGWLLDSFQGRFPPVEILTMRGFWSYTAQEVVSTWDFSNLTTLKLLQVNMRIVAEAMQDISLPKLRSLQIRHFATSKSTEEVNSATCARVVKLINRLSGLEDLAITWINLHALQPALTTPKPRLRRLTLRLCHSWHSDGSVAPDSCLETKVLLRIREFCPRLEALHISVRWPSPRCPPTLSVDGTSRGLDTILPSDSLEASQRDVCSMIASLGGLPYLRGFLIAFYVDPKFHKDAFLSEGMVHIMQGIFMPRWCQFAPGWVENANGYHPGHNSPVNFGRISFSCRRQPRDEAMVQKDFDNMSGWAGISFEVVELNRVQ